jgi:hypothetical protein
MISVIEYLWAGGYAANLGASHQIVFCRKVPAPTGEARSAAGASIVTRDALQTRRQRII